MYTKIVNLIDSHVDTFQTLQKNDQYYIPTKSHALCVSLTHLRLFSRSHAWKQSVSRMELRSNQATHYDAQHPKLGGEAGDTAVVVTTVRSWLGLGGYAQKATHYSILKFLYFHPLFSQILPIILTNFSHHSRNFTD